jgi:CAAX protease family protein
VGRINLLNCALTAAIILLSSSVLLLCQFFMHPDVTALGAMMPVDALGGVVRTGVVFALVNAVCEEVIFRGILFDALEAERGWQGAVYATAVLFALGHWNGYPPGWGGAILAGSYGIILGLLRVHTGALFLPIVAHTAADATIYGILVHEGAV